MICGQVVRRYSVHIMNHIMTYTLYTQVLSDIVFIFYIIATWPAGLGLPISNLYIICFYTYITQSEKLNS